MVAGGGLGWSRAERRAAAGGGRLGWRRAGRRRAGAEAWMAAGGGGRLGWRRAAGGAAGLDGGGRGGGRSMQRPYIAALSLLRLEMGDVMVVVFVVAWLVGIWWADWSGIGWLVGLGLGFGGVGIHGLMKVLRPWALVALLGLGCGILRVDFARQPLPSQHIAHLENQTVRLLATVAEEPRWSPERQQFVVEVQAVAVGHQQQAATGLVQLVLPPEPPRRFGEQLVLEGMLMRPVSNGDFDYVEYLARRDIVVILNQPTVIAVHPPVKGLRQMLVSLKEHARLVIAGVLPEPQGSLLAGILLGIQSGVAPEVKTAFQRTGTAHILVISGWNISIIVAMLLGLGQRLRWRQSTSVVIALAVIVVYVLLVGPSAAVVRAAVMGAIVACAVPLGRQADGTVALAAACWMMTLVNPQMLWDLGFQLSALATASLFAWGQPVEACLSPWLDRRGLRWTLEPLGATLAAQVWTLPLMLGQFGDLSLIAPLANVVMTPIVPFAMAVGAILTCAGLLARPLAFLILPLAWLSLWWLTSAAMLLAQVPWASVRLPMSLPLIAVWYAISGVVWIWLQRRSSTTTPPIAEGANPNICQD